jgi:hypothetical protein
LEEHHPSSAKYETIWHYWQAHQTEPDIVSPSPTGDR